MTTPRNLLIFGVFAAVAIAAVGYAIAARKNSHGVNLTIINPLDSAAAILQYLEVEKGYEVSIFADLGVPARQIALGDDGWVFVGSSAGAVHALRDDDGDGAADTIFLIAQDGNHRHGVAYHEGDLYVGAVATIYRIRDIADLLRAKSTAPPARMQPFIAGLPSSTHHGRRVLEMGPDGKLYVALGVPCNICIPESADFMGVIRRYDLSGGGNAGEGEIVARGIRNAVGMAFHPRDDALWFTDNGRDWLGDDAPHDELNRVSVLGEHFGYPFCHQGDMPDPEYGDADSCADYTAPALLTGPHVANLGMEFSADGSRAYIALHGSWNRSEKIGYAVHRAALQGEKVVEYSPFVTGWLRPDESVLGRPVDVVRLEDGALLVSDDHANVVYRISKTP